MEQQNAIKSVIGLVIKRYGITRDRIFENSREQELVKARREIMWLLREKVGLSYPRIAEVLNRDHSTVIHSLKGYMPPADLNVVAFDIDGRKIGLGTFDNGFHLVQPRSGKWSRIFQERGKKCEIVSCGFNDVLEVHHFISKKVGGTDELYNLIIVCPNHHTMIHQDAVRLNPRAYPLLAIPSYLSTD